MNSQKHQVIQSISMGHRVAEDERDELEKYFVETDQWQQLYSGKTDIVYGPKGTGKSALYSLISSRKNDLANTKGILLATAENIRGATVFKGLVSSPPPSEASFIFLWKLYCLVLIAKTLRENSITNPHAEALIQALTSAQLLPQSASISTLFRLVQDYLKNLIAAEKSAVEHSLSIDPVSGLPTVTRRVELKDVDTNDRVSSVPVDELLNSADQALSQHKKSVWILFDRLDVAFSESRDLERNALRALFRAYNDLRTLDNVFLKIFVRDDIWTRISAGGFSEASHIIKTTQITWNRQGLIDLIARRLTRSAELTNYIFSNAKDLLDITKDISKEDFMARLASDFPTKQKFVESILPDQVDTGKNPNTFDWMVSRVKDGLQVAAPRELIHMLESIRELQLKKLERGEPQPDGVALFDRAVFKEALDTVSGVRYKQTFLAEYPEYAPFTDRLSKEKAEQTKITLAKIWDTPEAEAEKMAEELVKVGFFEQRGVAGAYTYWVPFLYRGALDLIQGKAE